MGIKGIILDLDGTLYRGAEEVPGAARFVADMAARGIRCLFVTNRANRAPREVCAQLRGFGIACREGDVLTSAEAVAMYLRRGSAYVVGEQALLDELVRQGFRVTDDNPDYVIVSLDREFTYDKMDRASRAIRAGARFIATNADKAMTVEGGLIAPGTGSIVAAIATASGKSPQVIGKPERTIVDMALARLGMAAQDVIMVGDNVETDMPAGHAAGVRTVLVLTGISSREHVAESPVHPTWIVESFDELRAVVDRERST